MSKLLVRLESDDTTRDRNLKAAMLRFSTHSYEETGLRDLAADVGVDMAYVHRSFGSKEKLFYQAVKATLRPERVFAVDSDELPSVLAKDILAERGSDEIRPLDIVIRSFSSPDASCVLNSLMMEGFVEPLMRKREGVTKRDAALIGAFLCGVGILRDVIRAEAILNEKGSELEDAITQVIDCLLNKRGDDACKASIDPSPRYASG